MFSFVLLNVDWMKIWGGLVSLNAYITQINGKKLAYETIAIQGDSDEKFVLSLQKSELKRTSVFHVHNFQKTHFDCQK